MSPISSDEDLGTTQRKSPEKGFLKNMKHRIVRYCKKNEAEHSFYCSALKRKDEGNQGLVDKDTAAEDLISE